MTAKEYLAQLHCLDSKIKALEIEIEQLRYDVYGINSSAIDGERVQSSVRQDKITDKLSDLMEMSNDLVNKIFEKSKLRNEIIQTITRLPNASYIDVLMSRYVLMLSWESISSRLHISVQHCYRLHGNALQEVDKLVKEESK